MTQEMPFSSGRKPRPWMVAGLPGANVGHAPGTDSPHTRAASATSPASAHSRLDSCTIACLFSSPTEDHDRWASWSAAASAEPSDSHAACRVLSVVDAASAARAPSSRLAVSTYEE
jgi:hypothetical protein